MVIIMVLIQIACVLRHQVEQSHLPQERYLLSSDGVFLKWGYHKWCNDLDGIGTPMVLETQKNLRKTHSLLLRITTFSR